MKVNLALADYKPVSQDHQVTRDLKHDAMTKDKVHSTLSIFYLADHPLIDKCFLCLVLLKQVIRAEKLLALRRERSSMFTFVSNIPIFRRLFYAFLLAAIIPGIIISALGIVFINTQNTHNQAVQVNMNMARDTATISSALQRSKDLFNGFNGTPLLNASGQTLALVHTITGIQQSIETNIQRYTQQYQLASTPQMSDIRSMLLENNPGSNIVANQQVAIKQVEKLWPACRSAQERVSTVLISP